MNRTEFAALLADRTGCTKKHAEEMLNAVLDGIGDVLRQGERVHFVGFGSFDTKARAPRTVQLPTTGQTVEVPSGRTIVFRPGKGLKEKVENQS